MISIKLILGLLIFGVLFVIVPFLISQIFLRNKRINLENIFIYFFISFFIMLCLYYPFYILGIIFVLPLNIINIIYSVVIFAACIYGIIIVIKDVRYYDYLDLFRDGYRLNKTEIVLLVVFVLFLLIQLYFSLMRFATGMTYDDYFFVTKTSSSIYANQIILNPSNINVVGMNTGKILCSYEVWLTWLCYLTRLDATTITHMCLCSGVLVYIYMALYLVCTRLFDERENQILFMTVCSAVCLFSYHAHWSFAFRMFAVPWQGKAICNCITTPLLFYLIPKLFNESIKLEKIFMLFIVSFASCTISMTGYGVFAICLAVLSFMGLLYKKDYRYLIYIVAGEIMPFIFSLAYLIIK